MDLGFGIRWEKGMEKWIPRATPMVNKMAIVMEISSEKEIRLTTERGKVSMTEKEKGTERQ